MNDEKQPLPAPPSPATSWLPTLLRLLIGLLIVQHLHWPSFASLPRIQPCRYPTEPGGDVVWGFRVVSSPEAATQWAIEVGKIGDDALKGRLAESYVGLSDSWLYLRVTSGEETHLVLASLFLANLITREEAEAVLAKGPARSIDASTLIHRIPSFGTLGAAYYAGSTVGARKLLGPRLGEGVVGPVFVGGASAGGVAVLSSRSTRFSGQLPPAGQPKPISNLLAAKEFQAASTGHARPACDPLLVLALSAREEKEHCDFGKVEILPVQAPQKLAIYGLLPPTPGFTTSSASSQSHLERFNETVLRLQLEKEQGAAS
ncbi:hypothetical protein JCM6882_003815 [Rhodosporidiobolus microsporus]